MGIFWDFMFLYSETAAQEIEVLFPECGGPIDPRKDYFNLPSFLVISKLS